jgi:GNAT superfamily N-acetyltransferase
MPLVHYRQATKDDAQYLKKIAKRVIKANYISFLGIDATTNFIESGMSDKEIDDGLDSCTLIICDGRTIGFAITNGAILHLIMIDVPFQNSGYGSRLLAYIEEKLFSNFDRIHLRTFQENTFTVEFYLKYGWKIFSQEIVPELNKTMLHFEKIRCAN